jgi:hypothetical protein
VLGERVAGGERDDPVAGRRSEAGVERRGVPRGFEEADPTVGGGPRRVASDDELEADVELGADACDGPVERRRIGPSGRNDDREGRRGREGGDMVTDEGAVEGGERIVVGDPAGIVGRILGREERRRQLRLVRPERQTDSPLEAAEAAAHVLEPVLHRPGQPPEPPGEAFAGCCRLVAPVRRPGRYLLGHASPPSSHRPW